MKHYPTVGFWSKPGTFEFWFWLSDKISLWTEVRRSLGLVFCVFLTEKVYPQLFSHSSKLSTLQPKCIPASLAISFPIT